jgi:hypothetical protein
MFSNEAELHAARERGDMGAVYRGLIELGKRQIASIIASRRISVDRDRRAELVHDAASNLIAQILQKPTKRLMVWHYYLRKAIQKTLDKTDRAKELSLDELQEAHQ